MESLQVSNPPRAVLPITLPRKNCVRPAVPVVTQCASRVESTDAHLISRFEPERNPGSTDGLVVLVSGLPDVVFQLLALFDLCWDRSLQHRTRPYVGIRGVLSFLDQPGERC